MHRFGGDVVATTLHCTDLTISRLDDITPHSDSAVQPRAKGRVHLSVKPRGPRTTLDQFRQSGSLKCLYPRGQDNELQAVLVNTAGGVTGGDRFETHAHALPGTWLTLTTQACERAYRAQPGQIGQVRTRLNINDDARLNWLPQETILFDGSALNRRLSVDLAPCAELLLVEPLIFGRGAMGEVLTSAHLNDRIDIRRAGLPLYLDALHLNGDVQALFQHRFVGDGAGAIASVVFVSNRAEAQLAPIRAMLPANAGASLLQPDVLVLRLLAPDSFALRRALIPILTRLNGHRLPRCWTL